MQWVPGRNEICAVVGVRRIRNSFSVVSWSEVDAPLIVLQECIESIGIIGNVFCPSGVCVFGGEMIQEIVSRRTKDVSLAAS